MFFEFAEVRRAKSPALRCKANALPPGNNRLFRQSGGPNLYRPGLRWGGPVGNYGPRNYRNICRGRCLHRPENSAAPEGPREGHGPPLQTTENDRPNRMAATARAFVGRDALIPPGPAAGRTFRFWNRRGAAGVNARPTGRGKPRGEPEKRGPALQQTSVGDDACIVPGALRRGEACGRIWNPPLRAEGKPRGQPQTEPRRVPRVGAHIVRPGTLRRHKHPGRDKSRPYE